MCCGGGGGEPGKALLGTVLKRTKQQKDSLFKSLLKPGVNIPVFPTLSSNSSLWSGQLVQLSDLISNSSPAVSCSWFSGFWFLVCLFTLYFWGSLLPSSQIITQRLILSYECPDLAWLISS